MQQRDHSDHRVGGTGEGDQPPHPRPGDPYAAGSIVVDRGRRLRDGHRSSRVGELAADLERRQRTTLPGGCQPCARLSACRRDSPHAKPSDPTVNSSRAILERCRSSMLGTFPLLRHAPRLVQLGEDGQLQTAGRGQPGIA
jgi:hypothetical protein